LRSPWYDACYDVLQLVLLLECLSVKKTEVYAALFTIEAMMQLIAVGCKDYIFGASWAWNWLDIFVVTSSWIELVIDLISTGESTSRSNSSFRLMRRGRIFPWLIDRHWRKHFLVVVTNY